MFKNYLLFNNMIKTYKYLNNDLKNKVDNFIIKNNKQYFKNYINESLIVLSQKKKIIRFIINEYKNIYTNLKTDLLDFIQYYYQDQYFVFMNKVFDDGNRIVFCDSKYICNHILNNLSYDVLKNGFIKYWNFDYSFY